MGLASAARLRTAALVAGGLVLAALAATLHDGPAVRALGEVTGTSASAASAGGGGGVTMLTGRSTAFDPFGLDPAVAPAGAATIRPGAVTETAGAGVCTSSFVFTSGGRTLLGQAAHCGGTGAETETDGCTSSTVPLGTPVTVLGAGERVTGTLAYSSWVTMQQRGERGPDACAYNDFALVELPGTAAERTNPTLPFFGGPQGVRDSGLAPGAALFGLANPGAAEERAALRPRVGTGGDDVGGGWGHTVYTASPGVPGESGSPLLDDTGRAVGLLSSLNVGGERESIEYTDLSRAMDYARRSGGVPGLALSPGTEPFTPAPPGVAPADVAPPAGPPVTAGR